MKKRTGTRRTELPREAVLGRVRSAVAQLERSPHPGNFGGIAGARSASEPVDGFARRFSLSGGEVVRLADPPRVRAWMTSFLNQHKDICVGKTVPPPLLPVDYEALEIRVVPPEAAELGVSVAVGAVAESGSVVLDCRDGRRVQLLPPHHVVLVAKACIYSTLEEALAELRGCLPSALGLHSGPSKSADIGQVLVKRVHGPGRLICVVVG